MRNPDFLTQKIYKLPELVYQVNRWKFLGKKIVFTNGCFDILHQGHIYSLSQAAKEGDLLVVGVNADASVKKLKGESRPVTDERSRALLLASLVMVDAVVLFEEDTPYELITALLPDVIVKGGDYTIDQVVGAKEVIANGGRVVINPIIEGFSTTAIIEKLGIRN
ncbi:MAG TPA: D-glycero-beta-D-manno-heptose 1-phosphate adenylyltransferase [Chitinophagaceae bacterium]|nr:D-glycero-beta-D-manno-heptose 1-phosphate adenylyltransferase [Chitinophagaceae bacterium]